MSALKVQSLLEELGVLQSQVVAISMHRGPDLVAVILGCILHGAVFLLLHPCTPLKRKVYQLEVSRPAVLLCSAQTFEQLVSISKSSISVMVNIHAVSFEPEEGSACSENPSSIVSTNAPSSNAYTEAPSYSEEILYIVFTSGSTGTPKAVCASAAGTLNRLEWMWEMFPFNGKNEVLCFKTSIAFVDCI